MRFEVLGPIQVWAGTSLVRLPSGMAHHLLAVFLSRPNDAISVAELIDALWPTEPPAKARKDLQVLIHKLRRLLGEPDRIALGPGGYAFAVRPGELDADDFADHLRESNAELQADNLEGSRALVDQALKLWRGRPYAGAEECAHLASEIQRLDELRLQALEDHLDASLRQGKHSEVVTRVSTLVAEHPYRERFIELQMLALYRSDRQAEALEKYRRARTRMLDELGIEPSYALHQLHERILRRDPALSQSMDSSGRPDLFERMAIPRPENDNILKYWSAAAELSIYEPLVVPGLFQTEEYARALMQGLGLPLSRHSVQRAIDLRMTRQRLLLEDMPTINVVVDEAVLLRPIGSHAVYKRQLEWLRMGAEKRMASFQIVPISKGIYPGVQGAFTVVELDEDDLSALVYVESWAGNMFLFGADEVWRGRVTYDYLRRIALSPADSLSLLDQMIRDL